MRTVVLDSSGHARDRNTTGSGRTASIVSQYRPGRCLVHLEFTPFPLHEAREWDPALASVTAPPTLAEMYAATGTNVPLGQLVDEPDELLGHYL